MFHSDMWKQSGYFHMNSDFQHFVVSLSLKTFAFQILFINSIQYIYVNKAKYLNHTGYMYV
jgi:hypothetical protein